MDIRKNKDCRNTLSARLIIFYGPPCAGKTTLSRIIAKKLAAKRISIDGVRSSLKEKNNIFTDETNEYIFNKFLIEINRELKKNLTTVCEGLFISSYRKEQLLNLSTNRFNVIYITASEYILLSRLQNRKNELSNCAHELMYNMSSKELIQFYKQSIPPKYKYLIVNTGIYNENESIEKILNIVYSTVFTKRTISNVF